MSHSSLIWAGALFPNACVGYVSTLATGGGSNKGQKTSALIAVQLAGLMDRTPEHLSQTPTDDRPSRPSSGSRTPRWGGCALDASFARQMVLTPSPKNGAKFRASGSILDPTLQLSAQLQAKSKSRVVALARWRSHDDLSPSS